MNHAHEGQILENNSDYRNPIMDSNIVCMVCYKDYTAPIYEIGLHLNRLKRE